MRNQEEAPAPNPAVRATRGAQWVPPGGPPTEEGEALRRPTAEVGVSDAALAARIVAVAVEAAARNGAPSVLPAWGPTSAAMPEVSQAAAASAQTATTDADLWLHRQRRLRRNLWRPC